MSTKPLILVTGATGHTGSGLVPTLIAAGARVRALVHTAGKAEALREQGAEVVVADLGYPESLDAAVAGVDRIYLCLFNGPEQANHGRNLIAAARKAGRAAHRPSRRVGLGSQPHHPAHQRGRECAARLGPAVDHPPAHVLSAEHDDGDPDGAVARRDLPADEAGSHGDDRRPRHRRRRGPRPAVAGGRARGQDVHAHHSRVVHHRRVRERAGRRAGQAGQLRGRPHQRRPRIHGGDGDGSLGGRRLHGAVRGLRRQLGRQDIGRHPEAPGSPGARPREFVADFKGAFAGSAAA